MLSVEPLLIQDGEGGDKEPREGSRGSGTAATRSWGLAPELPARARWCCAPPHTFLFHFISRNLWIFVSSRRRLKKPGLNVLVRLKSAGNLFYVHSPTPQK